MESPIVLVADSDREVLDTLQGDGPKNGVWVVPFSLSGNPERTVDLMNPEIVVVDLARPDRAFAFLGQLKPVQRGGTLEIVVVYGKRRWAFLRRGDEESSREKCRELGVSMFQSKPLPESFTAKVAERAHTLALARRR